MDENALEHLSERQRFLPIIEGQAREIEGCGWLWWGDGGRGERRGGRGGKGLAANSCGRHGLRGCAQRVRHADRIRGRGGGLGRDRLDARRVDEVEERLGDHSRRQIGLGRIYWRESAGGGEPVRLGRSGGDAEEQEKDACGEHRRG